MKTLLTIFALSFSLSSFATVTCADLKAMKRSEDDTNPVNVIRNLNVLTLENWKSFDVILGFNPHLCLNHFTQKLIEVNGTKFVQITSNDDSCDGGNSHGAIFTEDLKTPVAHISDSDIVCEEDGWKFEDRAKNHKCDLQAEELAILKLQTIGFNLSNVFSTIEKGNSSSVFIHTEVTGIVNGNPDKEIYVKVLTDLRNCKVSNAKITGYRL